MTLAKICASEGHRPHLFFYSLTSLDREKLKELCPRENNLIWLFINNSIFIVNVYLFMLRLMWFSNMRFKEKPISMCQEIDNKFS
jgi:hypothetical protein